MDIGILIAAAVGTTAPCIGLWIADQRARLRGRPGLSRRSQTATAGAP
jgi:hypothetical protein